MFWCYFLLGAAIQKQKAQYASRYYKPNGGWEDIACPFNVDPLACQTAKTDALIAIQAAQTRYPGYQLYNDEADAFRHCYWSALMTQHIGVIQAKMVGDNHELLNEGPETERQMDYYNNAVGLQVGLIATAPNVAEDTCHTYAMTKVLHISP